MTQGGCARVQMEQMTWTEIRALLDKGVRTVIIPTGSMEQHGYHLSENTDSVLGEHIAAAVARALGDALVAPVLRPGLSEHHMAMAGTLTLRPETFRMLLEDYIDSYSRHGFNTIIIIAFHGGNVQPTAELLQPLRQRRPGVRLFNIPEVPTPDMLRQEMAALGLPDGVNGGHADDRETSEMLYIEPRLVQMDKAAAGFTDRLTDDRLHSLFAQGITALTAVGSVGDPRLACAERGERYVRRTVLRLVEAIKKSEKEVCGRCGD